MMGSVSVVSKLGMTSVVDCHGIRICSSDDYEMNSMIKDQQRDAALMRLRGNNEDIYSKYLKGYGGGSLARKGTRARGLQRHCVNVLALIESAVDLGIINAGPVLCT